MPIPSTGIAGVCPHAQLYLPALATLYPSGYLLFFLFCYCLSLTFVTQGFFYVERCWGVAQWAGYYTSVNSKGQGINKVLAKQLLGGLGTEWVFNYLFTLSPDWATPCFGCYFWMCPYIACVSWPHHAHIQYGHLSSRCPFVVYKDKHLQDLSLGRIKKGVEFYLSSRIERLVGDGG